MDMIKESKKELRKSVLDLRKSLSPEKVRVDSQKIFNKLCSIESFLAGNIIMSYVSFGNEVSTLDFIARCLSVGKRICVPLITRGSDGKKTMIPSEIFSIEDDLAPGTMGILEPVEGRIRKLEPEEIDLVIVPGIIFSTDRYRIGYGGGYYDRFLPALRNDCLKAGVAFEFQIRDRVPVESHDIPVDMVITEDRII
jgi:5-formyltetrahydrofolate cyclo-ligase